MFENLLKVGALIGMNVKFSILQVFCRVQSVFIFTRVTVSAVSLNCIVCEADI